MENESKFVFIKKKWQMVSVIFLFVVLIILYFVFVDQSLVNPDFEYFPK